MEPAPRHQAGVAQEARDPVGRDRRLHQRRQVVAAQPADQRGRARRERAVRHARPDRPPRRDASTGASTRSRTPSASSGALPHQLVEAFRSTLEEVADADLILHVVDASHPDPEGQIAAVRHVFADIPGAMDVPEIIVLNKADLATPEAIARLRSREVHSIVVSAHSGEGIDELQALVADQLPRPGVERRPGRPVRPRRPGQPGARARRHRGRGAHRRRHGPARAGRRAASPPSWRRAAPVLSAPAATRLTRCQTPTPPSRTSSTSRSAPSAGSVATASTRWRSPSRRRSTRASTCSSRRARAPGKSLGYLVPAVRHAVLENEHVVVSTATLALQRQIITRDLPLVAKALEPHLPRTPRDRAAQGLAQLRVRAQGRRRLPRRRHGHAVRPAGTTPARPSTRRRRAPARPRCPRASASRSCGCASGPTRPTPGDRDDLVPGVTDRAWRQVSVDVAGVPRAASARCSPSASPRRRKAASREADVVVTNHAMLGIAASGSPGVLPEHQVIVVDEAHELTDRVTAQATSELSVATVEHAARLARRHGGVPTTDLDSASQALGAVLVGLPEARFRDGLPPAARDAVAACATPPARCSRVLKPETGAEGAPPEAGSQDRAGRRCSRCSRWRTGWPPTPRTTGTPSCGAAAARTAAGSVLDPPVRGAARGQRPHPHPPARRPVGRAHLRDARARRLVRPDRPGGRPRGPPDAEPVGPTSLAARRPPPPAGAPWRGLDVGSPFDYPRQGILYIARHLPTPGREPATDAQLDEIAELITAAGGRTLGLFSSRRAANAAADRDARAARRPDPRAGRRPAADARLAVHRRRGHLPVRHAVALAGRRRARARRAGSSSSTASRSRGRTTRCSSARSDAVEKAGGNGFLAGLGDARGAAARAGCRPADPHQRATAGVVAVLDPRLATARYGGVPDPVAAGVLADDRPSRVAVSALQRLGCLEPG